MKSDPVSNQYSRSIMHSSLCPECRTRNWACRSVSNTYPNSNPALVGNPVLPPGVDWNAGGRWPERELAVESGRKQESSRQRRCPTRVSAGPSKMEIPCSRWEPARFRHQRFLRCAGGTYASHHQEPNMPRAVSGLISCAVTCPVQCWPLPNSIRAPGRVWKTMMVAEYSKRTLGFGLHEVVDASSAWIGSG